jgi:hypothetical protein
MSTESPTEAPRRGLHAASLESPRLKRVLQCLKDAGRAGLTTMEIIRQADVCAVNSIAAELRANGIDILCELIATKGDGGRIYRYTLTQE